MKKEKSCGALIFRETDQDMLEIMLVKMRQGHWSLPKGHMEPGETERETALREIKEETDIDVVFIDGFREATSYSPKPGVMKDVIWFVAHPADVDDEWMKQEDEIDRIVWADEDEARSLITFDNDLDLLNKAIDFIKTRAEDSA